MEGKLKKCSKNKYVKKLKLNLYDENAKQFNTKTNMWKNARKTNQNTARKIYKNKNWKKSRKVKYKNGKKDLKGKNS